jgi:hypothetical protein
MLIAKRDGTAQAFMAAWATPGFEAVRGSVKLLTFDSASHSFSDDAARAWFDEQILAALADF